MLYIYLKSYNINLLNSFCKNILPKLPVNVKGPIFLPKKRNKYTVIRSPHVYSLSREHFETSIFRRVFIFKYKFNFLQDSQNLLNIESFRKNFLKKIPIGISLKLSFKS